jgi:hypothetical protein
VVYSCNSFNSSYAVGKDFDYRLPNALFVFLTTNGVVVILDVEFVGRFHGRDYPNLKMGETPPSNGGYYETHE